MCSFHETGEFGGRKKGDVARSPPPNDHGFLLVHHSIENAGQIYTEACVRRFTRHESPNSYCTAFLYGHGDHIIDGRDIKFYARRANLSSQADLSGPIRVAGTFSARRSDICGAGSVPCPRFPPAATARETPAG